MDQGHSLGRIVRATGNPGAVRGIESDPLVRINGIVGPGRYFVSLPGGERVEVEGEEGLRIGDTVRVLQTTAVQARPSLEGPGTPWSAIIPLGFGGKGAKADLKVYVERIGEKTPAADPAVYLVMECVTELQKKTQWSLYLKGKSVAIQVYPEEGGETGAPIFSLIAEVEENLRKKGFSLSAPTLVLKRKFSVPRGFHLNVKG